MQVQARVPASANAVCAAPINTKVFALQHATPDKTPPKGKDPQEHTPLMRHYLDEVAES